MASTILKFKFCHHLPNGIASSLYTSFWQDGKMIFFRFSYVGVHVSKDIWAGYEDYTCMSSSSPVIDRNQLINQQTNQ